MPFLPGLAVVFAGILGGGHGGVDKQVKSVVHDLHVKPINMTAGTLRTLTHHGEGTKDIVVHDVTGPRLGFLGFFLSSV